MIKNNDCNDIKNINETYEEFNEESQVSTQGKSKGLWVDILIGYQIVNLVLIITRGLSDRLSLLLFIIFITIVIATNIIAPVRRYIKGRLFIDPKQKIRMILRISFVVVFLVSLYFVLFSRNYNLKYTYYVCILTMYVLILITYIEKLRNAYFRKMQNDEEFSIWNKLIIVIFFVVLILSSTELIRFIIKPTKQIFYESVVEPDYISVYEIKYDKVGEKVYDYDTMIKISDPKVLEQLTEDLADSALQSLSAVEQINYARQKEHNAPYYHISLYFNDHKEDWFETGDLSYLVVTSGHTAAIEKYKFSKHNIFGLNNTWTVYPVELSDSTYQVISSYLD